MAVPETIYQLQHHLAQRVAEALASLGTDAQVDLQPTPNPAMGDFGFPCFPLAKALRKSPVAIAAEVAGALAADEVIAEASSEKAYVNLKLRPSALFAAVFGQALREADNFGSGQADPVEHWMVEYSAPNTNKPLHLGHIRNNLLGSSVATMLRFYGHKVTRVNLINDRGVHICKSMLAYQRWGDGTTPESTDKKGDHFVGDYYVLFDRKLSEEYEAWLSTDAAAAAKSEWLDSPAGAAATKQGEDPDKAFRSGYKDNYFNTQSALGADVRAMLVAWENGDADVVALWRKMNDWVLAGFDASYQRMGVGFDVVQFESDTYKLGKALVAEGLEAGVLEKRGDGAVICDLAKVGLDGQKVLLRSDGTSVYMTQDLGTADERFQKFAPDHLVYVVGDEQNYHFDVLFRTLGLLREGLKERCHHLSYGMIRLPEGKMKSREGTVVDADDMMDEVETLARQETQQRADQGKAHTADISADELALRGERIGMAALKYFLLKFTPRKSFEYDPKASIDFLGQTGPYCLFNYARTRSLARKAGGTPEVDPSLWERLGTDRELEIARKLFAWPDLVRRAALGLDPSRVAEYLFELCKSFAFVFTDKASHPIVTCEDEQLRAARLLMVAAVGNTIKAGLSLLGVEVLEEM